MPRLRAHLLALSVGLALFVLLGVNGRGQSPPAPHRVVVQRVGPPAIDRGLLPHGARGPGDRDMLRREALVRAARLDRVGASGGRYVPGRVIVKFREGAAASSKASAIARASRSASLATRPAYANFDILRLDPAEDAEAVASALSASPDVEYAQAAYRVHTEFVPNDPYYPLQWNFPLIDLERAWDINLGATPSIVIAVLDTGIAFENAIVQFQAAAFTDGSGNQYPALGNLELSFAAATELATPTRFVAPYDFIWNDDTPLDTDGHGTHVSGTLGQLTNNSVGTAGVAFNVRLMPVKVIDSEWDDIFGSPNQGTDDVVAQGIRYAADNGAKILNMSIGRTGPPAPVIEDAINYAVSKGAFIAIAAGNDFENGNPTEVLAEIASRVQGAVSVAAVDRSENHAYYSSSGSWVELAAPGGSFRGFGDVGGVLQQTLDLNLVDTFLQSPSQFTAPRFDALAYYYFTGTSQATPHVSGVAALLAQQGITNPAAIEAALEQSATNLGDRTLFGYGLVEARTALRGLGLAR